MDCAQSIGPSSDSRQHISDKVQIALRDRIVEIQRKQNHTVPHIKECACINHWAEDSKDRSRHCTMSHASADPESSSFTSANGDNRTVRILVMGS